MRLPCQLFPQRDPDHRETKTRRAAGPKWRLFSAKNALFPSNRTHFSNNCSHFIAPAAHFFPQTTSPNSTKADSRTEPSVDQHLKVNRRFSPADRFVKRRRFSRADAVILVFRS